MHSMVLFQQYVKCVTVFFLSVELWWNATSTKQFSSTWSKHYVSHGFFLFYLLYCVLNMHLQLFLLDFYWKWYDCKGSGIFQTFEVFTNLIELKSSTKWLLLLNYSPVDCLTIILTLWRCFYWYHHISSLQEQASRRLSCQISTNQRKMESSTNVTRHWKTCA